MRLRPRQLTQVCTLIQTDLLKPYFLWSSGNLYQDLFWRIAFVKKVNISTISQIAFCMSKTLLKITSSLFATSPDPLWGDSLWLVGNQPKLVTKSDYKVAVY